MTHFSFAIVFIYLNLNVSVGEVAAPP